jgi:hypothetical protein
VSTAYCCGVTEGKAPETLHGEPRTFRNAYEQSKWLAEQACAAWAERNRASLTIHRPSIIVGDGATGRATRFDGFYVSARACQMIGRLAARQSNPGRRVRIHVPAPADATQNIVPVDYVAKMIAGVAMRPELHGQAYHLTHPDPPTNSAIREAFVKRFDLRSVDLEFACDQPAMRTELDEAFESLQRPILPYMADSPRFQRSRAALVEQALGLELPAFDATRLRQLLNDAVESDWGRRRRATVSSIGPRESKDALGDTEAGGAAEYCDAYFRMFLPARINDSASVRVPSLCATARFIITDIDDGEWACRFQNGLLVQVHRGSNTLVEDFAYHTDAASLQSVVSGEVDPQQLFFSGKAKITGDAEKALRMTVIFQSFIRQCPAPADSAAMREACAS